MGKGSGGASIRLAVGGMNGRFQPLGLHRHYDQPDAVEQQFNRKQYAQQNRRSIRIIDQHLKAERERQQP